MKKPRGDPLRTKVLFHVKALVQLLKLDPARAILEYRDAAQPVLALVAEGQPLAAASNPAVWSRVLEPTFVCTGRVAPLVFLPVMIRFYISIEDGGPSHWRAYGHIKVLDNQVAGVPWRSPNMHRQSMHRRSQRNGGNRPRSRKSKRE